MRRLLALLRVLPLIFVTSSMPAVLACDDSTGPDDDGGGCCRVCRTGCACGDTCIDCSRTCHVGPGCACDG